MSIAKWAGFGLAAAIFAAPTMVAADSYWEVEAARANARAGGPTNARDAELLQRYGCLSGTRSAYCQRLGYSDGRTYRRARRYAR
jgi:hypothetical protein